MCRNPKRVFMMRIMTGFKKTNRYGQSGDRQSSTSRRPSRISA
jgi:hypothetical protein